MHPWQRDDFPSRDNKSTSPPQQRVCWHAASAGPTVRARTKTLGSVGSTAHNTSLVADHPQNRHLPAFASRHNPVHTFCRLVVCSCRYICAGLFPRSRCKCTTFFGGCGLPLLLQLKTPFMEHAGWIGNHWKKPELAITTLWFVDFRDDCMGVLVDFRDNGA